VLLHLFRGVHVAGCLVLKVNAIDEHSHGETEQEQQRTLPTHT
jgi:hypothetical protein